MCAVDRGEPIGMCSRNHEALKADRSLWNQLPLIGSMEIPDDDEGPGYRLEMRNCSCRSTLAIEIHDDTQR